MNNPTKYGPHGKYVEVWGCQSESSPNKIYTVARTAADVWSCSCPRWTLNASRPDCKHIKHVRAFKIPGRFNVDIIPTAPMPEQVKKALGRFAAIEVD